MSNGSGEWEAHHCAGGAWRRFTSLFMGAFPHFISESGAVLLPLRAGTGAAQMLRQLKRVEERLCHDETHLCLP